MPKKEKSWDHKVNMSEKKLRKKWHLLKSLIFGLHQKERRLYFQGLLIVCYVNFALNTSITTKQRRVCGTHQKSSLKADLALTCHTPVLNVNIFLG